ncbi:putative Histidine kinase [Georgfuchsia toluolica]|uniref:histidine kinase n=1 Tax=Georgfuchsia toluolica TaxID=424218 RepID=A0A916J2P4_9PROT|nr:ATP-binding protein [Georgfuchsia toluolica]CAG4882886.1 putative Histidine kinase [Georgfuchsia toluolica]
MSNLLFDAAPTVGHEIDNHGQIKVKSETKRRQLVHGSRCPHQADFLISVSQELLPSLNGILMLAKLLAENSDNNLSPAEIDYAQTIYSSGTHLQSLIYNMIDLAKIESGIFELKVEAERFTDLHNYFVRTFSQVAQDKDLSFDVELVPGLPAAIYTDGKRLRQILDNLLSNAFKSTKQGGVTLRIAPAEFDRIPTVARSSSLNKWVEFSVTDTGTGISESKQRSIVETFHKTDSSISHECSCAGLGLSICGDLMRLLDGEIRLSSTEGMGSCFTLYLPLPDDRVAADKRILPISAAPHIQRETLYGTTEASSMLAAQPRPYLGPKSRRSDDGVVLIAESDAQTASLMQDLVRSNGYRGEVATNLGKLQGLIGKITIDAIILGMNPGETDAWAVFHELKNNPATRRVPISMINLNGDIHKCLQIGGLHSSNDDCVIEPAIMAATPQATLARMSAAAGRPIRKLLVANAVQSQRSTAGVVPWRLKDMEVVVLGTGALVVDALLHGNFDGMVVGASLLDMSTDDLMNRVMATDLPTDLTIAMVGVESKPWGSSTEIAILKRQNEFSDVLAETTQFLRRAMGHHPSARQDMLFERQTQTAELAGRKVLIIDDICNIYAITGVLEQQGMIVLHAENSTEGIEVLCSNPDTDFVLVDTAVPGLDSHDMIGIIRGIEGFKLLPIIAVVDKVMPGYRWECIEAGASDTIDKPVNVEQLLSLLRGWLAKVR